MPKSKETINENKSGASKGRKLPDISKIPPDAIWAVAERYGYGSLKYDTPEDGTGPKGSNWEKGLPWSDHYSALGRHLLAFWGGEDLDQGMIDDMKGYGYELHDLNGSELHIAAVAWHAMCLLHIQINKEHYAELDDRSLISGFKETK